MKQLAHSCGAVTGIILLVLMWTACQPVPRARELTVEIVRMQFVPADITVHKGDKIRFVNHDMVAHDVTEETSKKWSSSPLQPGQTWTLEVTGPASYYCSIHEVMKGKIRVE